MAGKAGYGRNGRPRLRKRLLAGFHQVAIIRILLVNEFAVLNVEDKVSGEDSAPPDPPQEQSLVEPFEFDATCAVADEGQLAKLGRGQLEEYELDVVQREYRLRAAVMYADVGNRMRNSAQWDKEDTDYKQKIADKQKTLDDAKQKLEDMKEQARKAGAPASVRE